MNRRDGSPVSGGEESDGGGGKGCQWAVRRAWENLKMIAGERSWYPYERRVIRHAEKRQRYNDRVAKRSRRLFGRLQWRKQSVRSVSLPTPPVSSRSFGSLFPTTDSLLVEKHPTPSYRNSERKSRTIQRAGSWKKRSVFGSVRGANEWIIAAWLLSHSASRHGTPRGHFQARPYNEHRRSARATHYRIDLEQRRSKMTAEGEAEAART